ncbi:hypothetical protein ACFLZ8_01540 [Planctomycetota bacterium]
MNTLHKNITEDSRIKNSINRGHIELLRRRLYLLDGKDKILMRLYLEHDASVRMLSVVFDESAQTINRRIERLSKTLTGREFRTFSQNAHKFSRCQKILARDYYLMRLALRQIARKRRWSYYRTRKLFDEIQAIIKRQ